jgi:hypothetical protein
VIDVAMNDTVFRTDDLEFTFAARVGLGFRLGMIQMHIDVCVFTFTDGNKGLEQPCQLWAF